MQPATKWGGRITMPLAGFYSKASRHRLHVIGADGSADPEKARRICATRMAGTTGLEPATSAVTGQRSNQLNYVPKPWKKTTGVIAMAAVPAKTPLAAEPAAALRKLI
jgi:hypothetical protein